ncbi:hypothetical protein VT930_15390 [Mycobacterium sherrisii]|uniref:hypothetical protein n=1 Tax=Mycobacterium sherrisii TaxID=243061 RepID=UPI002DDCFC82|nr:hypothetical protein [Mycobacterium sherrisii]MEC4764478.1 hypothetical protein [Mycobacterium sherrisii]
MEVERQVPRDELVEVARYYDLWRGIANLVGDGPDDEPDWDAGRLFFRSDYSQKLKEWPKWAEFGDWGAWIITPEPGYICVSHSLKHEREVFRTERMEVVFSSFLDAGKYVIMQLGDSMRTCSNVRLKSLFLNWEARGLSPGIKVQAASEKDIGLFIDVRDDKEYAEKHLKRYSLVDSPGSYGIALDYEQPRMEILALSFDELTAALLDGMPETITSKVHPR